MDYDGDTYSNELFWEHKIAKKTSGLKIFKEMIWKKITENQKIHEKFNFCEKKDFLKKLLFFKQTGNPLYPKIIGIVLDDAAKSS